MKIKQILIGLEIHVELKTESKMFCGCSTDSFGKPPNTYTCPVCLGFPGSLPVPNKKAIYSAILIGKALGCQISPVAQFDRKNYFYPDLPKGYQISQHEKNRPFSVNGTITYKIKDKVFKVKVRRVHLEEDTGKSVHTEVSGEKVTLLDFNKAGIPLVEIVSDPDLHSSDEAVYYGQRIRKIIRYLGVSDCDLEKGQMRFEPTINLLIEDNQDELYTPLVEIKNINSFRFLKKALDYEISRQFEEFSQKRIVKTDGNKNTRGFDQIKMQTFIQRHKEEADEYRYFPEPDIPPFYWTEREFTAFDNLFSKVELPDMVEKRFLEKYRLPPDQIEILTEEKNLADYFEEAKKYGEKGGISAIEIANIIVNKRIDFQSLSPSEFIAKIGESKSKFTAQESDINKMVEQVLKENPNVVEDYRKGKTQILGYLIGLVQKSAHGLADPKIVQKILLEKLSH